MKSKYSAEEKFQIVMESFTDNVTQAEICRRHGIYPVQLSKWREQFILGGKTALAQRRNSDSRDEEIRHYITREDVEVFNAIEDNLESDKKCLRGN